MMNAITKTTLLFFLLFCYSSNLLATCSPFTVSMSSGDDNATAFTADGQIGVDGAATYYVHWDNTYVYFGWSGGRTNYSSDLYYVAIDVDPSSGNGTAAAIESVNFDIPAMDYYVVYENNFNFYGAPASTGNAFELYSNSGGSWNFTSRTGGDDGTSSQINFLDSGGEARLRIAWADLGGFTPGAANDIRFVMWTNNSDGNFAWSSFPATNPTGGTPQTMNNGFTFASTAAGTCPAAAASSGTLPVDFGRFDARLLGETVQLDWSTFSEINNDYFELERSMDSKDWESIGLIDGRGNSFEKTNYNHLDQRPYEGLNYYRLKQVDYNGNVAYSPIISILFDQQTLSVFPNPVDDFLNINLKKEAALRLELYNLQGQLIGNRAFENAQSFEIDLRDLHSGLYWIIINDVDGFLIKRERILKN